MSAGMADIIAAHEFHESGWCACDEWNMFEEPTDTHAAHVAEELAKAGYGNVQEALLTAADEMPIETILGADKASVWLRQRAQQVRA